MSEEFRFTVEILRVHNIQKDKWTYFHEVAGIFHRISKEDYWKMVDNCDGMYNLQTLSTKNHVRHFSTIVLKKEVK